MNFTLIYLLSWVIAWLLWGEPSSLLPFIIGLVFVATIDMERRDRRRP